MPLTPVRDNETKPNASYEHCTRCYAMLAVDLGTAKPLP
jgi:hypothetical protein